MATMKLAYWPERKMVLVADETIALTIAYWPKRELVLIVPTAAGGGQPIIPRSAHIPHMALGQSILRRRG